MAVAFEGQIEEQLAVLPTCGCIGFIRRSGNIGSDRKDGKDMELTELCKSAKK